MKILKFILSLLIVLLLSECSSTKPNIKKIKFTSNLFFKLGEKLPKKLIKKKPKTMILSTSSQLLFCHDVVFNGILFSYGSNEKGIVEFIMTSDSKFRTEEGLTIKTKYGELSNKLQNKLMSEPGWAYYIPVDKHWNAAFVLGENYTERPPLNEDHVSFFFQRK